MDGAISRLKSMLFGEQSNDPEPPKHFAGLHPQLVLYSLVEHVAGKLYKNGGPDSAVAFEDVLFHLHHQIGQSFQEVGLEGRVAFLGVGEFEGDAAHLVDFLGLDGDGVVEGSEFNGHGAVDEVLGFVSEEQDLELVPREGLHGAVLELDVVGAFFRGEAQVGLEFRRPFNGLDCDFGWQLDVFVIDFPGHAVPVEFLLEVPDLEGNQVVHPALLLQPDHQSPGGAFFLARLTHFDHHSLAPQTLQTETAFGRLHHFEWAPLEVGLDAELFLPCEPVGEEEVPEGVFVRVILALDGGLFGLELRNGAEVVLVSG